MQLLRIQSVEYTGFDFTRIVPRQNIGIFGGTFNPIHDGHVDIALHAASEFGLEKVLLVPAGDPPHKQSTLSELAPKDMRFEMVQLAVFGHAQLEASSVELKRRGITYTVDTLRTFNARMPDANLFFIVGEDTLHKLDSWHDLKGICRLAQFICMRRPGEENPLRAAAQSTRLRQEFGATVHLSDYTGPNISSTCIRERVHEGKSIHGLVPDAVEKYIYATGLYE